MERRLLVAFALVFLVYMLFLPVLKKYGPQAPASRPTPQSQQGSNSLQTNSPQGDAAPNQAARGQIAQNQAATGKNLAAANAATPPHQAAAETETVIENDNYRIVFTNRGAQVKSWVLKKWDDDAGNPLELVNRGASQKYGYPLSLWTYDETLRNELN